MLTAANYSADWDGLAPIDPPKPPGDDELREWFAVKFFRHAAEEDDPVAAGDWVALALGEICRIDDRHVIDSRHWTEVQQLAPSVRERMADLPATHAPLAIRGVLAFIELAGELFECGDVRLAYRLFNEKARTRHVARVAGKTLSRLARDCPAIARAEPQQRKAFAA